MTLPQPLIVEKDCLSVLNGRLFPDRSEYLRFTSANPLSQALRECLVFGPGIIPPIVAQTVAMQARTHSRATLPESFYYTLQEALFSLRAARPLSRPLIFTLESLAEIVRRLIAEHASVEHCIRVLEGYAKSLTDAVVKADAGIAARIADLIPDQGRVMVLGGCGMLSSVGAGTGVAGIIAAHRRGKNVKAYIPFSAPLLSGPKQTAWELRCAGVPYEIVGDTAVGAVLLTEHIDCLLAVANRIALNGDISAPAGACGAALAARQAGVPFYAIAYAHAADVRCPDAAACPLEEFNDSEPEEPLLADARRYVNDLAPADCITAYITSEATFRPKTDGPARGLVSELAKRAARARSVFLSHIDS